MPLAVAQASVAASGAAPVASDEFINSSLSIIQGDYSSCTNPFTWMQRGFYLRVGRRENTNEGMCYNNCRILASY
jgi:hypothetical protein